MRVLWGLSLAALVACGDSSPADGGGAAAQGGETSQGGEGGQGGVEPAGGAGAVGGNGGTAGNGGEGGMGGLGGEGGIPCSVGVDATLAEDPGIVSAGTTFLESESSVVEASDGRIAVAFISVENGDNQIGYAFSTDGGQTFGAVTRLTAQEANQVGSDPTVAADSAGNIYLAWVAYQFVGAGQPQNFHVFVARADAGASTFGAPVKVTDAVETDGSYDKPWVTVLPDDSVVVTYAKELSVDPILVAARSTDGGQTFDEAVIADALDYPFANLAYPCYSAEKGRLYVVYVTDDRIAMRWSDDSGASWSDADTTNVSMASEVPAFEDPTCVAANDDVWIAYGLGLQRLEPALLDRVRVAHSSDGGETIASRTDAVTSCDGPLTFLPQLALADSGTLDVVFYGGAAEGDEMASLRWVRSTDAGATWTPSRALHDPVVLTKERNSPLWLGDYIGVYWNGSHLLVSYADNVSGFSHTAFLKITPD